MPVAQGEAGLPPEKKQVALRPDDRAERDGVGLGVVRHDPTTEPRRGSAGVVQLDPFVGEVGRAILIPVHSPRVGQDLVEGHAGRERGRRRGGGRCRRRRGGHVGPAGRGRVGIRPGAVAVGRAAEGTVALDFGIDGCIHLRAVGAEQAHRVPVVVQRHLGLGSEQQQERAGLQHGLRRDAIRRAAAICHVVQRPAAQVHALGPPVVELDPLVVHVGGAVAVPVDFGRGRQHLVQPDGGRVVADRSRGHRRGAGGRGSSRGRRCPCGRRCSRWRRRAGPVGLAGRGRIGVRPLARAVHGPAVAGVGPGVRVRVAVDNGSIGGQEMGRVGVLVQRHPGRRPVAHQEFPRRQERARGEDVRRGCRRRGYRPAPSRPGLRPPRRGSRPRSTRRRHPPRRSRPSPPPRAAGRISFSRTSGRGPIVAVEVGVGVTVGIGVAVGLAVLVGVGVGVPGRLGWPGEGG